VNGLGKSRRAQRLSRPGPCTRARHATRSYRMSAAAKPLGAELIAHEQALDQLFAKGDITPDRLTAETAAIGELQGRLRSVHLEAHLETRALLNPDQIARYERLRGYAEPNSPVQHHHHG
jgi:hypothetical protein